MLKQALNCSAKDEFNDDIRAFSKTLHFYSPKAYDFVRGSFRSALLHPTTLRRWCAAVERNAGFTCEAFVCFRLRSSESSSRPLLCSLIFDEVSIRKHIELNGKENFEIYRLRNRDGLGWFTSRYGSFNVYNCSIKCGVENANCVLPHRWTQCERQIKFGYRIHQPTTGSERSNSISHL